MTTKNYVRHLYATWLVLVLLSCLVVPCSAQTTASEQSSLWLKRLNAVAATSSADQGSALAALRGEIAQWLAAHPELSVTLPPAASSPSEEASALRRAAQAIIDAASSRFTLGSQIVQVTARADALSPVQSSTTSETIEQRNYLNVTQAVESEAGVAINHIYGNRNESGLLIRGFSSRGQAPTFLDGIPVYVPYDGYIDFNRFQAAEISSIEISKGFASPMAGPNALGGAVNIVTKKPLSRWEGDSMIGTGSGNQLNSSLRLGSRWEKFYAQGTVDWTQKDFTPLSGDMPILSYKNLPDIRFSREQFGSNSRDEAYGARLGYTPRPGDEYVFSFNNQKGQKGAPLYMGPNTAASYRNFWSWPYWNKTSYYFLSNTKLGEFRNLKTRVFYDQFFNSIDMWDNDLYSTMKKSNSEHSHYDDHADGATVEYDARLLGRHDVAASLFFKDDTHSEYGYYPAAKLLTPNKKLRDQSTSIAFLDSFRLGARWHFTAGVNIDNLNGLKTETYNSAQTAVIPYVCAASPNNASFSGCTAHFWSANPQASASYSVSDRDTLFVSFADRSRFPGLKDRYSSGMGSALPNPDLKPERAYNWNIGYGRQFTARTQAQLTLFRSDLHDAIESAYIVDPGGATPAMALCPSSKTLGSCSQNVNIGKETHEGVELSVRTRLNGRLDFNGAYSYLNRTIQYDFSNFPSVSKALTGSPTAPTGVAKNKLTGTLVASLPKQAQAFAAVRYEGGVPKQDTYSALGYGAPYYSSAFAVFDLGASFNWRGSVVQAGVKNLLDRCYSYTEGFPEAGRSWYVNLRYRFRSGR